MKRLFNLKVLFGLILGILISATVVYAVETYDAINVLFEPSNGLKSRNLQAAIDEVHQEVTNLKSKNDDDVIIYKYNENINSDSYCIYGNELTCKMIVDRSPSTMRNLKKGDIVSIKIPNSSTRMGFWVMGKHIDFYDGSEIANMYDLISQDNYDLPTNYSVNYDNGATEMIKDLQTLGKSLSSMFNFSDEFGTQLIRQTDFKLQTDVELNESIYYGGNEDARYSDTPVYTEKNDAYIGNGYFKFATLQDIERLCVKGEKRTSDDHLFYNELLGSEHVGQYVLESCPAFMNNPMRLANYIFTNEVYLFNYSLENTYNLAPVYTTPKSTKRRYGFKVIMSYYVN